MKYIVPDVYDGELSVNLDPLDPDDFDPCFACLMQYKEEARWEEEGPCCLYIRLSELNKLVKELNRLYGKNQEKDYHP